MSAPITKSSVTLAKRIAGLQSLGGLSADDPRLVALRLDHAIARLAEHAHEVTARLAEMSAAQRSRLAAVFERARNEAMADLDPFTPAQVEYLAGLFTDGGAK